MYHSVTFYPLKTVTRDDVEVEVPDEEHAKNTWTDWLLIPSMPPYYAPPQVNEQLVSIPGADGVVDLTDALVGRATFANTTGQWGFLVSDYKRDIYNKAKTWSDVYTELMTFFHGKRLRVVLEDDPLYYREGRFSVANYQLTKSFTQFTLKYNCTPYKYPVDPTTGLPEKPEGSEGVL